MRCWKRPLSCNCKIVLLDHQEFIQEVNGDAYGKEILDEVFKRLGLVETAYFGLRYIDPLNQTHWLDSNKKVFRQLKGKNDFILYFGVKFYAVDPCKLSEEATRYQFFLQLKQDVLQGRLPVGFNLVAELGAYMVQSELGDYDPHRHTPGYVSEFRIISNQTVELENKIALLHREMMGQQPALAELNYLEKVKWLEMYGVDLHPVLGEDNTEYFLGLTPTGVIVLRNKNKVANYCWSRIVKIFKKGKYFMIRVSDSKNNEENTYGFETPSKGACRHLYKCSLEQSEFFKTAQSSLDLCGLKGKASENVRNPVSQQFVRVPSQRYQRRTPDDNVFAMDTAAIGFQKKVENCSPEPPAASSKWERSESPKSTQSLPPVRGLYSSNTRISSSRRSISMESKSSNESRSSKRVRQCGRRRRGSDSESEVSKCSGKSRRRRNRSKKSSMNRESVKSRSSSKLSYVLVDSKDQWNEVQKKQLEKARLVHEAKVISPSRSRSDGGDDSHYHTKTRKHRKHRSRSRSPNDGKSHLPEELKKHLQFRLVDTAGMSESQLREIPYKVVKTSAARAVKVKLPQLDVKTHSIKSNSKRAHHLSKDTHRHPPNAEPPTKDFNRAVTISKSNGRSEENVSFKGTHAMRNVILSERGIDGKSSQTDAVSNFEDGTIDSAHQVDLKIHSKSKMERVSYQKRKPIH